MPFSVVVDVVFLQALDCSLCVVKFIAMKFHLVEFEEWDGGITYYITITLLSTCL